MHQLDPALEPMTRKERRELRRLERRNEGESRQRSKSARRLLLWSIAALVVVGVGWLAWRAAQQVPASGALAVAVSDADNIRGPIDAPVTLVEYSDFQCPACATFHPIITQILSEAPFVGNVRLVYRHFPLSNIHANATFAAQAAQAAGVQGKFWEMHDRIFETQSEWSVRSSADVKEIFAGYANDFGLDMTAWQEDLASDAIRDRVQADYDSGRLSAVTGTPSFFINSTFADVFASADVVGAFRQALTDALNANP